MQVKNKNLYENRYKDNKHFSFGKNWQNFLHSLNNERIENAKRSLVEFLGGEENIKGKSFVDIGCGSGLFSYSAYKLGASKVVSVDIDEFSVACANYLREKEKNPENWEIKQGSALDENFINSLEKFDIVYSWGVLHHTGDMYRAFDNVVCLIKPQGVFYTAIYGKGKNRLHGTSEFWLKIKRFYNSHGKMIKNIMNFAYVVYFFIGSMISLKNPIKIIKNYKKRGMNWYSDVIDWLGGYPYEFAAPDEVVDYMAEKGIYCKKIKYSGGLGCAEYLFVKVIYNDKK